MKKSDKMRELLKKPSKPEVKKKEKVVEKKPEVKKEEKVVEKKIVKKKD